MICINCFHVKTIVTNSRGQKKDPTVWRRRKCQRCDTIFTSYERPSLDGQLILRNNNHTTPFNLGKLISSVARSFQHNKQAADFDSYYICQTIETKLLMHTKELSTDDIAAITHTTLKKYDPIAAVQYAAQHDLITLRRRPGRPSVSYGPETSDRL